MKAAAASATGQPRREDIGGLIVLHLYGSYREMGRQHAELLGPLARQVYDVQVADWKRLIRSFGPAARVADLLLPRLWTTWGPHYEESGLYEEINGLSEGLRVSRAGGWRGVFGVLGSGTTTFVATRTATADRDAIIGKNSDWSDRYGLRRPVVSHYYPANGDLPHVMATWPLLGLPVAGVNEAGFALGLNFFNAVSIVASTETLNSTVVHAASRTLWHSTTTQPLAPFGEMVPFRPGGASEALPIPADPRLGTPEMQREAALIAELRRAVRLFNEGQVEEACAIWDGLAGSDQPLLQPHRLAWARARARWTLGRLEEATELLAALDGDDAPFDVRAHALAARGLIADRLGRRDDAAALYRRAQAYLDTHPDYDDQLTVRPVRALAAAGLRAPQTGPMPPTPDLQRVPS